MTWIHFEQVKRSATKSGACSFCGKKCSRTEQFMQTLNPCNKNKNGSIKNKQDIVNEIVLEVKAWKADPEISHAKCFRANAMREWQEKRTKQPESLSSI